MIDNTLCHKIQNFITLKYPLSYTHGSIPSFWWIIIWIYCLIKSIVIGIGSSTLTSLSQQYCAMKVCRNWKGLNDWTKLLSVFPYRPIKLLISYSCEQANWYEWTHRWWREEWSIINCGYLTMENTMSQCQCAKNSISAFYWRSMDRKASWIFWIYCIIRVFDAKRKNPKNTQ